ncbi:MAG: hypothetical protein KatS3mg131_3961 [Candidatus Tectimicrobiota bacterium]|nr:MAG: hypothetical protein KatS3mg131_3961 [Candidatus Tectomicrobia bacterium]
MSKAKTVIFHLRNGEQRVYRDITRVDDSRPNNVRIYSNGSLVAQINKRDVIKIVYDETA